MDARRGRCKHGEVIQREAAWPRGVTAKMRGTRRPAATVPARDGCVQFSGPSACGSSELDRRLAYKRPCASRTARSARACPKWGLKCCRSKMSRPTDWWRTPSASCAWRRTGECAAPGGRRSGAPRPGRRPRRGRRPPLLAQDPWRLSRLSLLVHAGGRDRSSPGMSGWAASSPSSPGSAPTSGSSGSCPTLRCARGGAPRTALPRCTCMPQPARHWRLRCRLAKARTTCMDRIWRPCFDSAPNRRPPPPPPPLPSTMQAGLSVAAMVVPQGMSYAQNLAFLPQVYGLVSGDAARNCNGVDASRRAASVALSRCCCLWSCTAAPQCFACHHCLGWTCAAELVPSLRPCHAHSLHFPCSRGRVLAPGVLNDAPSPPACLPACLQYGAFTPCIFYALLGSSRQLVGGCVLPDGAGQHVPSSMQSTAARMRLIVRYQEGSGPAAATAKRSIQTRPNNNSIHPLHPPTQPTAHRLWGQCPSPLSSWGRACPTSTGNSRVRRRGLPATGHAAAAAAARSVRPNRQPPPPSPPPLQ